MKTQAVRKIITSGMLLSLITFNSMTLSFTPEPIRSAVLVDFGDFAFMAAHRLESTGR